MRPAGCNSDDNKDNNDNIDNNNIKNNTNNIDLMKDEHIMHYVKNHNNNTNKDAFEKRLRASDEDATDMIQFFQERLNDH